MNNHHSSESKLIKWGGLCVFAFLGVCSIAAPLIMIRATARDPETKPNLGRAEHSAVPAGSQVQAQAPDLRERMQVTFAYWQSLKDIERRFAEIPELDQALGKSDREAFKTSIRRSSESATRLCDEVRALNVGGVDGELLEYAQEVVANYSSQLLLLNRYVGLINEDDAMVKKWGGSFGVFKVLTDTIGGFHEVAADQEQLNAKALTFDSDVEKSHADGQRLKARRLALRIALTNRYGREFP